jgi:diacylglycerol kinase family enzyme
MISIRQVGIIFNPRSGRRRASSFASSISVYFSSKGVRTRSRESSRKYCKDDLIEFLSTIDVLIIVGGDGTIRSLLPVLAETGVPVVLFPAGNESLISRQFGISTSIPDLYEKVLSGETQMHYYAELNQIPFFLMAGVGLDSEVVKQVDKIRTEGSSNLLYLRAGVRALMRFKPGLFSSISGIDYGESLIRKTFLDVPSFSGSMIISNSSLYARSFIPVPEASSQSPFFSVRLFHEDRVATFKNWLLSLMFRKGLCFLNADFAKVKSFTIQSESELPLQLDGDFIGDVKKFYVKKSEKQICFIS